MMTHLKINSTTYADLDTFFYSCKYRDNESDYTYGCSCDENATDGQCLDSGCPFLTKVDLEVGNKEKETELAKVAEVLCFIWKDEAEDDGYLEQVDGWGEDTIMAYEGDIENSPFIGLTN
ncbi:MAG: Unknown protein [uncultured Sulfurovum sp.]|uniref:Uncharacterized protein n=1 Tax=uncultured Sulfurovum sp. TaxID=269237 RepID=A0A6S6SH98_9BACT|nr:MAG: Unknown protein [uncultured Sulfurovum sp.]